MGVKIKMAFSSEEYLMHHGIKGQKWGVRRYQNPDGTLTEAGKKRYGTVENFEQQSAAKDAKRKRILRRLAGGAGLAVGAAAGVAASKNENVKTKAAELNDKLNSKTVKAGKDKENMSPSEKVVRETGKGLDNIDRFMSAKQRKKELDRANEPIDLSDDELRKRINRLNMEKQYRDLLRSSSVDIGYEKMKENINMTASIVGIAASVAGIAATVHTLRKK